MLMLPSPSVVVLHQSSPGSVSMVAQTAGVFWGEFHFGMNERPNACSHCSCIAYFGGLSLSLNPYELTSHSGKYACADAACERRMESPAWERTANDVTPASRICRIAL